MRGVLRLRAPAAIAMVFALALNVVGASAATAHWSLVTAPDIGGGSVLEGVSCTSMGFCMSAGNFGAERWNGTAWSVVGTPSANSLYANEFRGISCTSATFCIGAGDYYDGSAWQTLIERWNGTTWALVPSPNAGRKDNYLAAVSCVSTAFCVAVGYYDKASARHTLVEQWNGRVWGVVSSPDASAKDALHGVSCTSTSFCVATGNFHSGSNIHTLIEQWSGSAWGVVSSPNVTGSNNNQLDAASCTSISFCAAVGYYNIAGDHTLTELWNGTRWTMVSSPNPGGSDILVGVSCTGASTACTAAGSYTPSSPGFGEQTLIESWTGAAWGVSNSPNSSPTEDHLDGVGCVDTTFCMSVGQSIPDTSAHTLIEKYSS